MARSSTLLLAIGGAALLAAGGLLVNAVHSDPNPEVTATRTSAPPVASRATPTTPSATGPTARAPMWRPKPRAQMSTDSADSSDTPAPSLADDNPPPASRENTKNLHFGGTQLRAQNAAVQPLVEKCISDAAAKGLAPSGLATLTYIVAKQGDKVAVEDTGIDDAKTTLEAPELLDCMRETARAMKFEGLPREAEGLVVTRSVKLEAGKLVEYKHVGFSYLR